MLYDMKLFNILIFLIGIEDEIIIIGLDFRMELDLLQLFNFIML
jgi:hypothetical protein